MRRNYAEFILAVVLFGMNGVITSYIALSSYEIVFFRTMFGSLILMCFFFLTGHRFTFWNHWLHFFFQLLSGIANAACWLFLYEGYQQIGVGITTLLSYCGPIIAMIFSPIVFKEKLTKIQIFGFLTVIAGFFLLNGKIGGEFRNTWGILCGILSGVLFAVLIIFNKKAESIVGLEKSTLQMVSCFLTVAAFIAVKQGRLIQPTPSDWPPILILGIVNTGLGALFYYTSMGKLPVQATSVLGYLEPLSALVFSFLILGETMDAIQIAGALLILSGVMIAELIRPKSAAA